MKRLLVILAIPITLFSQAAFPTTTLTNNLSKKYQFEFQVGSVTNVFGPNIYSGNTLLLIDSEAICVNRVLGLSVYGERGCQGTQAQDHLAGATVYAGRMQDYKQVPPGAFGQACVASNYAVLPWIVLPGAEIWNCTNGVWVVTGQDFAKRYVHNPFVRLWRWIRKHV